MKKFILALMALAMLLAMAVPAFADYASAQDGDLLYTVNFNGSDDFAPSIVGGFKYWDININSDGSLIEFKGKSREDGGFYEVNDEANGKYVIGDGKDQGSIWAGKITSLPADATTKYTMTYQIWMNDTDGGAFTYGGKNCYIGIGGMWESAGNKWYSFTSNYFTATPENRAYSMRRNSGTQKDADGNAIAGVFDAAMVPVKDNDGFMTVKLTFDGTTATFTSYILTSGTGANASDWTKIADAPYTVSTGDYMAFAVYGQKTSTHAKIKNVNIYKGLVTGAESAPSNPETGDTFTALPVALLVMSGAALAFVLKKKENA